MAHRRLLKHQTLDDDFSGTTTMAAPRASMLYMSEDLIQKFSGSKTYPVTRWIQDIEDNTEIFGWTPTQQLLLARRSLEGTAALWLRAEKTFKTWDELKQAIAKEFPDVVDAKTIHKLMSRRKKQANESCIDYMLTMKELGRRGKMADYVAVKYVVDGIQDAEINKIMLYGVTSYNELKEKLKIYEELKSKINTEMLRNKPVQNYKAVINAKSSFDVRCYSCGEKKHVSEACPYKQQGMKCFQCNEFGHISSSCPLRRTTIRQTTSATSGGVSGGGKRDWRSSKVGTTATTTKQTFIATTEEGSTEREDDNYVGNNEVKNFPLAEMPKWRITSTDLTFTQQVSMAM
jgi:hypothetical protein